MIELIDVTRTYGKKVAVANLSLEIARGELFAFLGHNGAGKTTTIKMMVGLLQPTAGVVRLCGYDAATHPRQASRLVGYVPDQPYLYDKLTGREFLGFAGEIHGMAARDIGGQIERQIEAFRLEEFIDSLCESYSHGMKQRLVFAASMLHDPQVLIVDEPMVGLDPRSMRLVKDLLRTRAAAGTTVFMSTHTLSVAEEIADRIGVVENGRLLFLGTVAQLRSKLSLHDTSLEHLYLALTEEDQNNRDSHVVHDV